MFIIYKWVIFHGYVSHNQRVNKNAGVKHIELLVYKRVAYKNGWYMCDICHSSHSKLWNAKEKVSLGIALCGDPQKPWLQWSLFKSSEAVPSTLEIFQMFLEWMQSCNSGLTLW